MHFCRFFNNRKGIKILQKIVLKGKNLLVHNFGANVDKRTNDLAGGIGVSLYAAIHTIPLGQFALFLGLFFSARSTRFGSRGPSEKVATSPKRVVTSYYTAKAWEKATHELGNSPAS